MAVGKEFMGSSLIDGSSFVATKKMFLNQHKLQKNQVLVVSPVLVPLQQRRVHLKKAVRGTVAAVSEDIMKANSNSIVPEKAVKFKVRAVVTVRNKHKQDLKETLVKHLDAITDKIGRNVTLELISTEADPSESISVSEWWLYYM